MTARLQILRGVPGSGKSTYAETLRAHGETVVNRDSIRFSLYGAYWGPTVNEDVVTSVENAAVEAALKAGEHVVLDATNLVNKNLNAKLSFASRWGAEVVFTDFPISYGKAVGRDLLRDRTVGAAVIKKFFKRFRIDENTGVLPRPPLALPTFEPYIRDTNLQAAYIIDTDGTVANMDGVRGPYDHHKYHLDTVHRHVAGLVQGLQYFEDGITIIGLSGRDEEFQQVTTQWWTKNGIPYDEFYMRPKGDKRMDAIVKYELFKEHIEPNYNVLAAVDDRPQVIRMWQTIGVPVINVGTGEEF